MEGLSRTLGALGLVAGAIIGGLAGMQLGLLGMVGGAMLGAGLGYGKGYNWGAQLGYNMDVGGSYVAGVAIEGIMIASQAMALAGIGIGFGGSNTNKDSSKLLSSFKDGVFDSQGILLAEADLGTRSDGSTESDNGDQRMEEELVYSPKENRMIHPTRKGWVELKQRWVKDYLKIYNGVKVKGDIPTAMIYRYIYSAEAIIRFDNDKAQHFWVGWRLGQQFGPGMAAYIGWYKEWEDLTDLDIDSKFDYRDHEATKRGGLWSGDPYEGLKEYGYAP